MLKLTHVRRVGGARRLTALHRVQTHASPTECRTTDGHVYARQSKAAIITSCTKGDLEYGSNPDEPDIKVIIQSFSPSRAPPSCPPLGLFSPAV